MIFFNAHIFRRISESDLTRLMGSLGVNLTQDEVSDLLDEAREADRRHGSIVDGGGQSKQKTLGHDTQPQEQFITLNEFISVCKT